MPSVRSYVLGTGLSLGLLLGILYGALLSAGLSMKGQDFLFLYTPARILMAGHAAQLYDYHTVAHMEAVVVAPLKMARGGMPNVYPPYIAPLMVPLALLPYNAAYFLWLAFNAVLLLLSLRALETYAGIRGKAAVVARFAVFLFLPVLVALLQGQTTIVVLAGWTLAFVALRGGSETVAGLALSVTLIKPQYALPWLIVLVLTRRWRALSAVTLVACLLIVLAVATAGLSIIPSYVHSLLQTGDGRHEFALFDDTANRGLAAFFNLLLPAWPARITTVLSGLCALLLLCRQALRDRALDLSLGLAVVVALLVSPHVLIHDLTLLLIPFAVALRYRHSAQTYAGLGVLYIAIAGGFLLAFHVRFQLPTLAMAALALWLFRIGSRHSAAVSTGSGAAAVPVRRRSDRAPLETQS